MDEIRAQTVTIDNRNKITMTAVESVDGFSEQQISLTVAGTRVLVTGENLKIGNFSKTNGSFCAEGKILGVKFNAGRQKLAARLFK